MNKICKQTTFFSILIYSLIIYTIGYAGWNSEIVDQASTVGSYCSIATSSTNTLHIAYYDSSKTRLKYAKYNGTSWDIQQADNSGSVGNYTTIAVDSLGNPHITYYDNSNYSLKYASYSTTTGWETRFVDNPTGSSQTSSLTVDHKNVPHIVYYRYGATTYSVKYASWSSVAWSTNTVDIATGYLGKYMSIAVDSNNIPHISYYDETNADLKYAKLSNNSWDIQTVDSTGNVGTYNAIAVDTNNVVHITYLDSSSSTKVIKYAKFSNSSWTKSNVISGVGITGICGRTIAVDSKCNPHIIFYSTSTNTVKYAKFNGSSWDIETVANVVSASQTTDPHGGIAVDSNDNPHVCYYSYTETALYHAKKNANSRPTLSWSDETGYITDGLNPTTGNTNTTFVYKIKYTDLDNTAPATGYPKVSIKLNNVHINGSPFTMLYSTGEFDTGAVYYYSTKLSSGSAYIYFFEAYDLSNTSATPTSVIAGPTVSITINHSPTLNWTNETGYKFDGINPGSGNTNTTFYYRIKYTDSDDDEPATGYPKVYIEKGGTDIPGSPFNMTYSTGDYTADIICSYSTILSTGSNYTYYFVAYDINNATAPKTTELQGPVVTEVVNSLPVLSWTGEANYTNKGLNPITGSTATVFVYRIKYTDVDNDAPATGYPKVYIKKGGTDISGSPFNMPYSTGNYITGVICSYSISLSTGSDYTYYFETYDVNNDSVTTTERVGPTVTEYINTAPTLSFTNEPNYTNRSVYPTTGDTSTMFVYRIKYTDYENDAPLTGYPKLYIKLNGADISNSPFTMNYISGDYVTGAIYSLSTTLPVGSYTYYFAVYDVNNASHTMTEHNGPTVSVQTTTTTVPSTVKQNEVKIENNLFTPDSTGSSFTKITYNTTSPGDVSIKIYTLDGKLVKTLVHQSSTGGSAVTLWDGKNNDNEIVSSGIYYVHIETPDYKTVKKVCIIK